MERKGFIVALENSSGLIGYGEVAPLENMDEAFEQLKRAQKEIAQSRTIEELVQDSSLFPCVRFGLDTAWRYQSLVKSNYEHEEIFFNAMLSEDECDHINSVKSLFEQGYRTFKVKIGFRSLEEDIRIIHNVYETCIGMTESKISLRLDAKRNYTLHDALLLTSRIKHIPIEYIEDPLRDTTQIAEFYRTTKIPVALDETLRLYQDIESIPLNGIGAFIIKPSLTGSISDCLKLINHAQSNGINPIISGYFESGFGLSVLALLAAQVKNLTTHGLSTYQWLADDVLHVPFKAQCSKITSKQCAYNLMNIDFGKLSLST